MGHVVWTNENVKHILDPDESEDPKTGRIESSNVWGRIKDAWYGGGQGVDEEG